MGDKIDNDGRGPDLLFFDAGALDVAKIYGADSVRAPRFRVSSANFEAFSVGIRR